MRATAPAGGRRSTRARLAAGALLAATAIALAGCAANPTGALSRMAHLDSGTILAADEEPPAVAADAGIERDTLRLLVEADGHEFWVGATSDDEVCFVAAPIGSTPTSGAVDTHAECLAPQAFGRFGATLRLGPAETRYWLHTEYMTVDPGWTELSANVARRD